MSPQRKIGYAGALAQREAIKARHTAALEAKVASQQEQLIALRKQLAASVARERAAVARERVRERLDADLKSMGAV